MPPDRRLRFLLVCAFFNFARGAPRPRAARRGTPGTSRSGDKTLIFLIVIMVHVGGDVNCADTRPGC